MKKKVIWLSHAAVLIAGILLVAVLLWGKTEEEPKDLQVETPYCTLTYPAEWESSLATAEGEENGVYFKTFRAVFSDVTYDLFTLYFGPSSKGTLFGYLKTEENTPVYIECPMLPEDHTLSAEEEAQFYEMMDGINTVVASIDVG